MYASILALATTVPPYKFSQNEIALKLINLLSIQPEKAKAMQQLYQNSAINTRYSALADYISHEGSLFGKEFPTKIPGTFQRNEIYKEEAPKLAFEAAEKALKKWGGRPENITHVISVSCTGLMAPGIEFDLMERLNLQPSVQRLGINFMGCFGAFKALGVAQSFAKENPKNRILLVCTELCSLHFQTNLTTDNILANSLFSDGAAAAVVGCEPNESETSLWKICNVASLGMENSRQKMKWDVGDTGFIMKLCHTVPVILGRKIGSFIESLVGTEFSYAACDWAIHPGGKSIIQAIERALDLEEGLTQASWDTLANYGNMSSATFLFVLNRLIELKSSKKFTVGLGFGPGLSVEGLLLSK